MTRSSANSTLVVLSAICLSGCLFGGKNKGKDDSSVGEPVSPTNCENSGTLDGCASYDNIDCAATPTLDGLPGGWFNDDGNQVRIGLARTNEGLDIEFTLPDAAGMNDGSEYNIPTEVLTTLTDTSGKDPVVYYACAGTFRVISYTPGELLWANLQFQARGPMGLCNETDYWTVGAELINAGYCKL